jgi:hypothetical protein
VIKQLRIIEGLHIQREMQMDNEVRFVMLQKQIPEYNSLGRLYNVVQHPTIAAPFLDSNNYYSIATQQLVLIINM